VRLIMTSEDVIHSAFVPAFRLKYDVLPGRYTSLWFEATRPGEYHLFCAEYCGTQHAGMIGSVIVMEPRQYQDWLAGGQASAPLAQAGEQLFAQLGCSSCHSATSDALAPQLAGLFGAQVPLEGGGTVVADENYLRESILFPMRQVVAGYEPIMPTYEGRISEEQLVELVAYLKSLGGSPGAGQPETPGTVEVPERNVP
jgi:cytochrome c oxidase subunit 2